VTAGCGTLPGMADSEGSMGEVERALLALSEEIGRLSAGMNAVTERLESLERWAGWATDQIVQLGPPQRASDQSRFLQWVPADDESKPGDDLFREAHKDRGPA
jgi:hypothetical protein